MSYYQNFKIIIGTPLWRKYLRWAYKQCIDDLKTLDFTANFSIMNFTALLCGVGNETTADEFISFVINRNDKSKIIIVDLGPEQIEAVTRLVRNKYKPYNIHVIHTDALYLSKYLQKKSINWIETDGFLEFFDTESLDTLLYLWNKLLKQDGFITIREPVSNGLFESFLDPFRIWVARAWLGVTIYKHTKQKLETMLRENNFRFVSNPTLVPTFQRFSIIKS